MKNHIEIFALLTSILVFGIYLFTIFPTIAPYRDAGEMVSVAYTLGVAHPPGYPLYTLLGKIWLLVLPIGNFAYRMNLLSAIFSALTAFVFAIAIKDLNIILNLHTEITRWRDSARQNRSEASNTSPYITCLLAILLSTSYLQWYLSLVSEMYTVNTFFVVLLLAIVFKFTLTNQQKYLYLFAFISGLGVANRLDLVLFVIPLSVYLLFRRKTIKFAFGFGCVFLLGFSAYLYLPLRSAQYPLLDWNHPATLQKLYSTLTRKTHGGTLDLLSTAYASGENFFYGILFYIKHLFFRFAFLPLPLGIFGIFKLFRLNKKLSIAILTAFFLSGPVFIYLSNMPPNPHALAILEAHFLMPNVIFAIFVVVGIFSLVKFINRRLSTIRLSVVEQRNSVGNLSVGIVVFIMILLNLIANFNDINKRLNFFADDYSRNVLRSLPNNSIAILKEDVQLFSMWYKQLVCKKRKDISVVAQGLAGSQWYQNMFNRVDKNVILCGLRTSDDWMNFFRSNSTRSIFISGDVDFVKLKLLEIYPFGLVSKLTELPTTAEQSVINLHLDYGDKALHYLDEIYIYRGKYHYPSYREFFTPDLIEEYTKARHRLGHYLMSHHKEHKAEKEFLTALYYQPNFPVAAYH
ncbi:MAG: DUF2723 domain-containing protein, partial [Elusimicrobiota bacterium]|nr:DUF2723 domain-containing protein [Elusimicrobiota bacterium]